MVSMESCFSVSERTANPTVLPPTPERITVYPSSLASAAAASVTSRLSGHISERSPSLPAVTCIPRTVPVTPRPGM